MYIFVKYIYYDMALLRYSNIRSFVDSNPSNRPKALEP